MARSVDDEQRGAHLGDGRERSTTRFGGLLRWGPFDANLTLLAAWSAIGLGAALLDGSYTPGSVVIVAVGVLLLVVSLVTGRSRGSDGSSPAGTTLVVATVVAAAAVLPAGIYGTGPALYVSRALTVLAALLLAAWVLLRRSSGRYVAYAVVVLMAAAGVSMVLSSPKPAIDTWFMLQAVTHGLSQGHNIYAVRWTSGLRGGVSNHFTYLPGVALLFWPFHALFGDVRYGLLAAMVLTALILIRVSKGSENAAVAGLFLLYPRFLFGLEQSWPDPLSLLFLSLTGFAVTRGRRGWAVVAFAAFLSCKPYNWLLIPFAVLWRDFGWRRTAIAIVAAAALAAPWAAANIHAFVHGVITLNFNLPFRRDSLSLNTTLGLHGLHLGTWFPATAIAVVFVLTLWRAPRDTYGFFLGSATVVAVFNICDRLSFFNEWEFAGGLTFLAVVFGRSAAVDRLRTGEVRPSPAGSDP
jgi:hypothetical protein